jgi:outer membrane protein OmpA-like peptidoglycan-associated protein
MAGIGAVLRENQPMISSRKPRRLAFAALLALSAAGSGPAAAAGDVALFQSRVPSVAELAFLLWPQTPKPQRRTRSLWARDNLDLAPAAGPVRAAFETEEGSGPARGGFAFLIRFAFDSTEVLPESRPFLDRVGELLASDRAEGRKLRVVGHADASGPDDHNQKLSDARAAAVRDYLMVWYGVPGERLAAEGRGERELRADADPLDPVNRRVEFLAAD